MLQLPMLCLLLGQEDFMLREFTVGIGHKCHFQDVCHVTDRQNHIPPVVASCRSGSISVFSFCLQGLYTVEETVCLGLQKRKLLGRGSIALPVLIKQRQLQLPHHNSSLYLFLLPSILPQGKSFLPAGFPNAIALSMVHSTQFINAKSFFLKEQGDNTRRNTVYIFLQAG